MKKAIAVLMILGIFISCKKNSETVTPTLVGKWKLVEILSDPGDGSGTYHSVSSNKTLEFKSDSTVISNGSLCSFDVDAQNPGTGTYTLSDNTMSSSGCGDLPLKIRFEISGSTLIVYYPCIEACGAKFIKN